MNFLSSAAFPKPLVFCFCALKVANCSSPSSLLHLSCIKGFSVLDRQSSWDFFPGCRCLKPHVDLDLHHPGELSSHILFISPSVFVCFSSLCKWCCLFCVCVACSLSWSKWWRGDAVMVVFDTLNCWIVLLDGSFLIMLYNPFLQDCICCDFLLWMYSFKTYVTHWSVLGEGLLMLFSW